MYFFEEPISKKPKDIARILNVRPSKISEWAREIEKHSEIKFTKTSFGSFQFTDSDSKLITEYSSIREYITNTKDAVDILKASNVNMIKKDNHQWARRLNTAIWRRH